MLFLKLSPYLVTGLLLLAALWLTLRSFLRHLKQRAALKAALASGDATWAEQASCAGCSGCQGCPSAAQCQVKK